MGHIEPFAKNLRRRDFLIASITAAGGMAIGISIPQANAAAPSGAPWDDATASPNEINAWIVIEPDDSVIIRVAKAEMGEGTLTSMPMIVAEELGCDWSKVRSEYASGNRNMRENMVYKTMMTGGSSAVRSSRPYLQQAGASARARLIEAAARRWNVPASECTAAASIVSHAGSGRSLNYGALAGEAAKITLAKEPEIKTPEQFTMLGKPTARLDTKVKVTGEAIFGIDVRLPDMLYAAVVTCPVPGGTIKSYDPNQVSKMRGVQGVVQLPDNSGVAVVADRFWRAKQAALALSLEWNYGAGAGTSSEQFAKDYRDALKGPLENAKTTGDVGKVFGEGKAIEALYEVPYLAHATMEPLNCTVQIQPDRIDVWMGTQAQDMTIGLIAKTTGMKPEQIFIHNCFLGGGFGRRAINDEVVQGLAIAKALSKPVKLVWTREEDMRRDRYRPQAAIAFKATLGKDGMPTAIQAQTAVGSIMKSIKPMMDFPSGKGVESMAVEGLVNMPYAIPNLKVDAVMKNTHVPVMFWRSVGSSQNAFAVESFIDELAFEAKQDPYQFRRKMLADKPDFLKVLDMVAEKSNWGEKMPAGKGRGIAIHEAFGTIVGEVVEVAIDSKGVPRCERVVVAVDCGHVINPRNVEMQMESGVIYGLTAALYDEITVRDGAIEQGNFDSYQIVRMADSPKIETYLALSGGTKWGGIGEPGTPPIAPALCNAIFAATGKRVRQLPIRKTDLGSRV